MVQMQGGNDVDYPGVISTSCQRSRCAVIGRPAGRRGEEYKMHLFVNNATNSTGCMEYCLKPSRIQEYFSRSTAARKVTCLIDL
ncbi:hypothetical protein BMS3Bbin14_01127 [bacterium BMS3Bbin14]|nr:hypothetical protein BMS3Abin13_00872 [bacterium BMS3Abin13]GBE52652.1 hypothetical protein BMS3Bbin14_01127 [bacterium BMS3Bbin14]